MDNRITDINIELDTDKCLFQANKLNYHEEKYLEGRGYHYKECVPIGKQRPEGFYIKKNTRESLSHTFLVNNIKEEIEKYTNDVKVYITTKPDIIFKTKKNKLIALEIETGNNFKLHKKRIKNKFKKVKEKYENCFIILTTKKMKPYYKRLIQGIPVMVRTDILYFLKKQMR